MNVFDYYSFKTKYYYYHYSVFFDRFFHPVSWTDHTFNYYHFFFEFFFAFREREKRDGFPYFGSLLFFLGGGIQREVIIEERGEKAVYLYASVCVCVYVSVYARARERERDADGVIPDSGRHGDTSVTSLSWLLPPSVLQCGCRNPTSFFLGAFLSPLMKNQHWIQWNWPTMNIPPFFHLFFRFASLFTWLFLSIFLICFLPPPLLSLSQFLYNLFARHLLFYLHFVFRGWFQFSIWKKDSNNKNLFLSVSVSVSPSPLYFLFGSLHFSLFLSASASTPFPSKTPELCHSVS